MDKINQPGRPVSCARLPAAALILATLLFVPVAAGAQAGASIAVVDIQRLITDSSVGRATAEEFQALVEAKQEESEGLQKELQQLQQQLDQGQLSLSEERQEELAQQLEDKRIALQRFQADSQRELQAKQREMFQRLERRILPLIQQIGQQNGYKLIFNKFESGLLYAAPTVDVTEQVLTLLDQAGQGEAGASSSGGG